MLTKRSSPSAEQSKRAQIEHELRLTPLERAEKALADVQELLVRTQVDRTRLDELAERYNMQRELAEVLGERS